VDHATSIEIRTRTDFVNAHHACAASRLSCARLPRCGTARCGARSGPEPRVAGENVLGGTRQFVASLGTQVVKIFGQAAARTGLRDHEAAAAGFDPVTTETAADDHKAYYPGSHRITLRVTGDRGTGRLLGLQLFGHKDAEIAKRVDIAAAAIFHGMTIDAVSDLDLSYTPPLGSPWDAVQIAAQAWVRQTRPR
jgi:Pyridine nucleotide-disulphide oxidoreductase, dimerisation domain